MQGEPGERKWTKEEIEADQKGNPEAVKRATRELIEKVKREVRERKRPKEDVERVKRKLPE